MYWDTGNGQACHDSIGMSSPHRVFYLPGGQSGYGFERWYTTWTLVQNPNDVDVKVKVSYLTRDGSQNSTFVETVPANLARHHQHGRQDKGRQRRGRGTVHHRRA